MCRSLIFLDIGAAMAVRPGAERNQARFRGFSRHHVWTTQAKALRSNCYGDNQSSQELVPPLAPRAQLEVQPTVALCVDAELRVATHA